MDLDKFMLSPEFERPPPAAVGPKTDPVEVVACTDGLDGVDFRSGPEQGPPSNLVCRQPPLQPTFSVLSL